MVLRARMEDTVDPMTILQALGTAASFAGLVLAVYVLRRERKLERKEAELEARERALEER